MAYDKMKWHYEGKYPEGMPSENAGTHIGIFLAWCIKNNLQGEDLTEDCQEDIEKLLSQEITGRTFLIENCDEAFIEDDLNDEGQAFAEHYYAPDDSPYFTDYFDVFGVDVHTIYEVENTWENYNKIKSVIDKRFQEWKSTTQ